MTKAEFYMSLHRRHQLHTLCETNLKTSNSAMSGFLTELCGLNESTKTNPQVINIFVDFVKDHLDRESRNMLPKFSQEYKDINEELKSSINKDRGLRDKLELVERKLTGCSLSIYHLFREMGQIYEAMMSEEALDYAMKVLVASISNIHVFLKLLQMLILSGFPFELMDGDAGSIPIIWIKSILQCLSRNASRQKMFLIVSVLGVQSSGKSTLLNSMFGVQFPVSVGRCTRGVYAQLIHLGHRADRSFVCLLNTYLSWTLKAYVL